MKRIFIAITICATLILITTPIMAASNVILDKVDIGDLTSEQDVVMSSWGPLATPPGDVDNSRVIWHPSELPEPDPSATIILDHRISHGAAKALLIAHLDGIADDSFEVYVKDVHGHWVHIGKYDDEYNIDTWVTTQFDLPNGQSLQLGRGGPVEVMLYATGAPWAEWNKHGQVQIDWIELVGNGGN